MLDPAQLRSETRVRLADLGYPDPPAHLPALFDKEVGYSIRPIGDLVARTAALNVVVALSHGMPLELAGEWVSENDMRTALSNSEVAAIDGQEAGSVAEMRTQVEAIWAFVWVLSLGDQLDPNTLCPDDLVRRVPDLLTGESIEGWRKRTGPRQRSADEVMRELDLHYGMTWGLADANLRRLPPPGRIDQYAIWQRRRALEFAIAERDWTHDEWDIIDLST